MPVSRDPYLDRNNTFDENGSGNPANNSMRYIRRPGATYTVCSISILLTDSHSLEEHNRSNTFGPKTAFFLSWDEPIPFAHIGQRTLTMCIYSD